MCDPYAYRHVSDCTDLPDNEVRLFSPTMRVLQVHCDSPWVGIFMDMHKARRNIFLGYDTARMPQELVAEMHHQHGSRGTCVQILESSPAALQRVLDIEFERNDITSGRLIAPFVALAKVLRASKDIDGVIQEIRNGI